MGRQVVAVLDAKYRDLWETTLPREMLYQLTVYALSQASCTTATILYPTASASALNARIAVRDPLTGLPRGRVSLRPVQLERLAELVSAPRNAVNDRARSAFASYLVSTSYENARVFEPSPTDAMHKRSVVSVGRK
jgi:5-methylcytosine-specific restriction enzyme subunit McrC